MMDMSKGPEHFLEDNQFLVVNYFTAESARTSMNIFEEGERLYEEKAESYFSKVLFSAVDLDSYPELKPKSVQTNDLPKAFLVSNRGSR
jgi:hypothetical protein